MARTISWGIVGCGKIAEKFASDLALIPDARLVGVASRDLDRRRAFAKRHGATMAVATLEEMLTGPEGLDVVYVATPNHRHAPDTLACLEAGVAVLCEKPFGIDLERTRRVTEVARRRRVFCMEAMWTRFAPSLLEAQRLLAAGAVGRIVRVEADFGFIAAFDPGSRLFDLAQGGGSLLDVGIYPLFLASCLLGRPDVVEARVDFAATGVDQRCAIELAWAGGATAGLLSSFVEETTASATVRGTEGTLRFEPRFYRTTDLELVDREGRARRITFPKEGFGYHHEARHVGECLRQGLVESPLWPLSATEALSDLMDRVLRSAVA